MRICPTLHTLLRTTAGAICMGIGLLCIIFLLKVINLLISTRMATLNHLVKGKELQV